MSARPGNAGLAGLFKQETIMMKSVFLGLASSLALASMSPFATSVAAQGLQHTFLMRGQVVDVGGDGLVVCIGREDGAQPGQVLDVVRVSADPGPRARTFRRDKVGQIRIEHIVDAHFAHATLISGSAEKHDLVELRREKKQ
jgi:hypothetical protein